MRGYALGPRTPKMAMPGAWAGRSFAADGFVRRAGAVPIVLEDLPTLTVLFAGLAREVPVDGLHFFAGSEAGEAFLGQFDHKHALPSGYQLRGYRVVEVLGVGGFGITYLAHDDALERRVAVKEYLPNEFAVREGATVHPKSAADQGDFEWGLSRFLDEARTLARFRHPNMVRVVAYFEANRTAYIVMDYEEGLPLDRLLERHGTLSERQLKGILLPVFGGSGAVEDHSEALLRAEDAGLRVIETERPQSLDAWTAQIGGAGSAGPSRDGCGVPPASQERPPGPRPVSRSAWTAGAILAAAAGAILSLQFAGLVELTLGAEEHRSVRVEAEVPKGGVGLLERVLERIPHGTLTLDLDPSAAEVTLPGIGSPYRSGMRVAEGSHPAMAVRSGYREAVHDIMVSGDTVERIKLEREAGSVFADALSSGGEGPEMVVIPAGAFRMGCVSGQDCNDDQLPVREVSISSFALSKHEVTFNDWDACVSDGGCNGRPGIDAGWGRGDRPKIEVFWEEAQSYVEWLSEVTGHEYRLPTEAEWEYAARAGTETKYSWGNGIGNNQANCRGCGSQWDNEMTAPVGSFGANAFGLHDMHGNVWEWVEDCWNDSYEGAPSNGSAWLSGECRIRVLRGGSWYYPPIYLRSAYRLRDIDGFRFSLFGFRVARTLAH